MNTTNGNIINQKDLDNLPEEAKKDFVEVANSDMTFKQQSEKQVSKHDNRSKLGKKFTSIRNQQKFGRKY